MGQAGFVERKMAYQPIWDIAVDIAIDQPADYPAVMASIFGRKMIIVGWKADGGAGHAEFTLRGTRAQILDWMKGYYDPSGDAIGPVIGNEHDMWAAYVELFAIKNVA
jgi:hypothetical protein